MVPRQPLIGRRLHIAGSIGCNTTEAIAAYAHELVRQIVRRVLEQGGGIVVGAGKEPTLEGGVAQVFDWSVLSEVARAIRSGICPDVTGTHYPIVVVTSEKGEQEIPDSRRDVWSELLESGRIDAKTIMAGARSAVMIRQQQAWYGDILLIMGGGTGVEHLAQEYKRSYKAVIPLDLPLGASREDGTGGAERLARESRENPLDFIRFREDESGRESTSLALVSTKQGEVPIENVVAGIIKITTSLQLRTAFYVRLLNPEHQAYERVERFFRNVVDPVIEEHGLDRVDLGKDRVESGFLNVEIFQRLHQSSVAIVDITGERPNCFIELGYALARNIRVLCTAEEGTNLPFDQSAIPCYFWKDGDSDEDRKKEFRAFWMQHIDRGSLVP